MLKPLDNIKEKSKDLMHKFHNWKTETFKKHINMLWKCKDLFKVIRTRNRDFLKIFHKKLKDNFEKEMRKFSKAKKRSMS